MMNLAEIESIFNAIPTASVILRPDAPHFTIATCNSTFLSVTYTRRSTLIGQHFFEAFPENTDDDGSRTMNIIQAFEHVLKFKTPHLIAHHRYDLPSTHGDGGGARYWKIETYPLLDEEGNISYIVQSSTDVTALVEAEKQLEANNERLNRELLERKLVENALKTSNDRYKYVNKATNDAIYDWDIEADDIHWGEAFFRLFGQSKEEKFSIKKWAAMVHPKDFPALDLSLGKALSDPAKNFWTAAYRIKTMNCGYAYVDENGYILRDEQGKAVRMIGALGDVTGQQSAQAELKSLKNTYTDLFQLSPLPMWVYDLNSLGFLDVNDAAIAHYGYTKDEFLRMSILDIRPKEDAEQFIGTIKREIKPRLFHNVEARHLKKSGEVITVNTKGTSIRYGVKEARIVVAIDITEKKLAEQALIKSERRFKTLIQEGSDLIAILDSEGNYKYVSNTVERILKVSPDELIGKNAFSFVHQDDMDAVIAQFQSLNEMPRLDLEPFRFVTSKGQTHWIETIVTDMRADEAINGIVCNSRVVTERVETEIKIKAHLDRYNAVSQATSDAIWDLDLNSGELLWNHAIKGVFGYEVNICNYQWWHDRVHPDDITNVTAIVNQSVADKVLRWTCEYRFRCADGDYKYVLDRGFLIFDDHSGHLAKMIGAMQDISERVAYTKVVEEHNVRLREIAWTQAHLVRSPLARILGMIPLLTDPQTEEFTRQTMFGYLKASAEDLDGIIREVITRSCDAQEVR